MWSFEPGEGALMGRAVGGLNWTCLSFSWFIVGSCVIEEMAVVVLVEVDGGIEVEVW